MNVPSTVANHSRPSFAVLYKASYGSSRRHWKVFDELVHLGIVYSASVDRDMFDIDSPGSLDNSVVHWLVPFCSVVWGPDGISRIHDC